MKLFFVLPLFFFACEVKSSNPPTTSTPAPPNTNGQPVAQQTNPQQTYTDDYNTQYETPQDYAQDYYTSDYSEDDASPYDTQEDARNYTQEKLVVENNLSVNPFEHRVPMIIEYKCTNNRFIKLKFHKGRMSYFNKRKHVSLYCNKSENVNSYRCGNLEFSGIRGNSMLLKKHNTQMPHISCYAKKIHYHR